MYKKVMGAIISKTDDEFYIIKDNDVYHINETAARIFDLCNGKNGMDDIIQKLSSYFEVSSNDLSEFEEDVNFFLSELVSLGLVRAV